MSEVCGICLQNDEELFHLSNSPIPTCRKCIKNSLSVKSEDFTNDPNASKMSDSGQTVQNQDVFDNVQECPICGKYFARQYSFLNHVRNHSAERKHICQYCQKAFTQAANLRNHERIHTNERPFGCSVCQKAFTQITNLNNHMRLHTGERPFQCPVEGCDKAFAQVTNLNNHAKTHQRDKLLKCDICHKTFFHYTHLNQHYRTHKLNTITQTYERMKSMNTPKVTLQTGMCNMPSCFEAFETEQELKNPVTKHTPKQSRTNNKYISCYFDSCNRKFANSDDLSNHLMQIHGLSLFNKFDGSHDSRMENRNEESYNSSNDAVKCLCCNKYHNSQEDLKCQLEQTKLKNKHETETGNPYSKYKDITITSLKADLRNNSSEWNGKVH